MSARFLQGREAADRLLDALRSRAEALAERRGRPPRAVALLVAPDASTLAYVRQQKRVAARAGLLWEERVLEAAGTAELRRALERLSADPEVDAVLLGWPLPAGLDPLEATLALDPAKDADGLHPLHLGLLAAGRPRVVPATARAALHLIRSAVAPEGREALVIGRSRTVGLPVALLLEQAHATVRIAHSRTRDLRRAVGEAEILVAAAGRPGLVEAEWLRPGAVVIDVGTTYVDGRVRGDVDPRAAERAAAITPVPGGVGPLTTAMLMENVVELAEAASPPAQGLPAARGGGRSG
ncbi:MAG: bifunctional 5,10-methylenetetrahydrofolate dehydrogenase/5,10-methenyltetrahydrofolate cyclohydrolase [Bacillota bacterium]|nr:bifunctional 5,10-methylenetetrahydrofolate dehydrogenase/5,10-methenyltetrahydrofolate cyclohydrolase [Bacillota bacterium]